MEITQEPVDAGLKEKPKAHSLVVVPERFDANRVEVQGKIIKIWSQSDGVVYANVALDFVKEEEPQDGKLPKRAAKVTIAMRDGLVDDEAISLMRGDRVRIGGWIEDIPQPETLKEFLARAQRLNLFDKYPDQFAPIAGEKVNRFLCGILPEEIETVDKDTADIENDAEANNVILEGTIARTWGYGKNGHKFARLAIYDRYTKVIGENNGNNGRPKRKPHYATVMFPYGHVDGREIILLGKNTTPRPGGLRPGDRIRIVGKMGYRRYRESFRKFLMQIRQITVLNELPNSDKIGALEAHYPQNIIEALRMIQYT